MKLSVGIIVNSNYVGGINKLSSLIANDIADDNLEACIYVPILPFYTYYVKIFKKTFFWLLRIVPIHLFKWLFKKPNSLDAIDENKVSKKYININITLLKLTNQN